MIKQLYFKSTLAYTFLHGSSWDGDQIFSQNLWIALLWMFHFWVKPIGYHQNNSFVIYTCWVNLSICSFALYSCIHFRIILSAVILMVFHENDLCLLRCNFFRLYIYYKILTAKYFNNNYRRYETQRKEL